MRAIRKNVYKLLALDDEAAALEGIMKIPASKVISSLIFHIQSCDENIKWGAVRAMGRVVSAMALENREAARVVMRRLMWSLNDESGGIGWGSPEAMGEIMAESEPMAREYHRILVSYVNPQGNYLEFAPLRAGAEWGLERLTKARPRLMKAGLDSESNGSCSRQNS